MTNAYLSKNPIRLVEVAALAQANGYHVVVDRCDASGSATMIHLTKGQDCPCGQISEEVGMGGDIYVGCMGDPRIGGFELVQDESEG